MVSKIYKYFNEYTKAAPLAVFRILFGLLLFVSLLRFWWYGWIEKLYILPTFHFHYQYFDWVIVPGQWTYLLFAICGLATLGVTMGYKYRVSIVVFFLSFTYIELMDKTTYLNHYYFISGLAFLMIWLPMHAYFSVDAYRGRSVAAQYVPQWNVDVIKILLAIVYIYAGAAKLNYDWMVNAMPLTIWLPTKFDIPLIGSLLHQKWVHYAFSWGGAAYDLFIVFFLMWKRTRVFAFAMVVIFHLLTRVLFPIGMFPYIMIMATLIFFDAIFHEKVLGFISKLIGVERETFDNQKRYSVARSTLLRRFAPIVVGAFLIIQVIFPLRYLLYDGNVFWTEKGYRFAWRVMLMEKTGYANFKVVDGQTGKRFYIQNEDFLTAFQQKQMATQVDFIVEYAQYLGRHFESQGHENVEVYAESYASLNGRPSQKYINSEIDLMKVQPYNHPENIIIPLNE